MTKLKMDMDYKDKWNNAAKHGLLDVIYELHLSDSPGCTEETMDYAALGGHIDIFHFLFLYRTEGPSEKAFYWATISGQIEMIKTLYLFFPEKFDVQNCIKIAKFYNKLDIVASLKTYLNKCYICDNRISTRNLSSVKNTCKKCYYVKFPHMKPLINCHRCNVTISNKNSSIVKKRCKNCFNYIKRDYTKVYRDNKKAI